MTEKELEEFYYSDLKWCGCGEPVASLEFLGKVLRAIYAGDTSVLDDLIPYKTKTGLSFGYLYTLDAYGLIEHGTDIRYGWLTDKGKEVMKAIFAYDLEKVLVDPEDGE